MTRRGEGDLTRLESSMSFMQVRASMSMKEKLRQVRGTICVNRREITHTRPRGDCGGQQPLQPDHHLREGPFGRQGWRSGVRDEMLPGGGATAITQELHGRDPCDGQRDGCLRRPHQLHHQECRITHPLQRCHPRQGTKWGASGTVATPC
jgi:hypothetical protein